jgi:uncharacterized caspase-like protein
MTKQAVAHTWLKLDADNHTDQVVSLAVCPDGRTVVSAGECTVRVWDAATRKPIKQMLGHTDPRIDGEFDAGTIACMALSPDGRWVVTSKLSQRIEVFDVETGNLVAAFEHPDALRSLAFSPDGRWLALAVRSRLGVAPCRARVQLLSTRALIRAGFDQPPEPVAEQQLARLRRGADLPDLELALRWMPGAPADRRPCPGKAGAELSLVVALESLSHPILNRLDWLAFRPGQGLTKVRSVRPGPRVLAATLAVGNRGAAVATEFDGTMPYSDPPQRMGRLILLDHRGRQQGEAILERPPVATVFSPQGDELAVSLEWASEGGQYVVHVHVLALVPDGFEFRSTYYGHDLPARAMAWLNPDCVLSAGGDNNAIHLWNPRTQPATLLGSMRGLGQDLKDPDIDEQGQLRFSAVPERLRSLHHRQQRFDLQALRLHTHSPSLADPDGSKNARWTLQGHGQQTLQIFQHPELSRAERKNWQPEPLTLFVGADNRWVLWTRSGYYATNAPEKARIGYCVDRGPRREALFVPAERFAVFDREDIVRAVVRYGSEQRARAHGVEIPQVDVAAQLPPVVEIERIAVAADRREACLHLRVEPLCTQQPTTRLWILRNERHVWFEADARALRRRRWTVPVRLNPGRNQFKVHAQSATAKSVPCAFEVQGPAVAAAGVQHEAGKGKLFLLSVGVSDFLAASTGQAGGTLPLKHSHHDATAVYNALACSRRSARFDPTAPLRNDAFESVEAALLVQQQATKAAILAQIRHFADQIAARERTAQAERDVLLVFLSGHGTRFKGEPELYFWNWDLIPTGQDMARTGLSVVEFAEIVTAVPAEVVFIIDACHAGMAGNNMMRAMDPEELARRIHAVHERGMYIVAASRSGEFSYENYRLRNGVLTSALLRALHARRLAAGKPRSVSMFALVAAVQELVPLVSASAGAPAQTPVCRLYGDLLPLDIYQPPHKKPKGTRLRERRPSATVARSPGTPTSARNTTMATQTAGKKSVAKKAPPAKKADVVRSSS